MPIDNTLPVRTLTPEYIWLDSGQSKAPRKNKAVPCPRPGFFQGNFSGRKLSPTRHAEPSNFSCKSLKTIRVATRYSTLEIGPPSLFVAAIRCGSPSRASDAESRGLRRGSRKLRKGRDMTVSEVAAKAGLSVSFLSGLERRQVNASAATLRSNLWRYNLWRWLVEMLPGYLAGMHAEASKTRWPPKRRRRAFRRSAARGRPERGSAAANRSAPASCGSP